MLEVDVTYGRFVDYRGAERVERPDCVRTFRQQVVPPDLIEQVEERRHGVRVEGLACSLRRDNIGPPGKTSRLTPPLRARSVHARRA